MPDIQELIDKAVTQGKKEVAIPAGTYYLSPGKTGAHISLANLHGFRINAAGVRLVCRERSTAISIVNCSQVLISGFVIDYQPMLYTQGDVISVSDDGAYCDIRIHPGYLTEAIDSSSVEVYEGRTRQLKTSVPTLFNRQIEKTGVDLFRIYQTRPFAGTVHPGDQIVLCYAARRPHGIYLYRSAAITLRATVIHAAPVFAIYEDQCSGNLYQGIQITPGEPPAGATEPQLRSATADGIHSNAAEKGPVIRDCLIENNGDDGIAIHGNAHFAVGSSGHDLTLLLKYNAREIKVGDELVGLQPDGSLLFSARVTGMKEIPADEQARYDSLKSSLLSTVYRPDAFHGYQHYQLDRPVTVPAGCIVFSPDHQGNGFRILNNVIRNKRARGILVNASHGMVKGNTISGVQMAAIAFCPDYRWMEPGYSDHISIRNNRISHCNFNPTEPLNPQAGVISVSAASVDGRSIGQAIVHRHISIRGNRLTGCSGIQVLVTSSTGINVHRNVIKDPNRDRRDHGSALGLSSDRWVLIRPAAGTDR
ncbi:MAG: hypothetical protein ABW019_14720 [Chitinophagaceae bacterium]